MKWIIPLIILPVWVFAYERTMKPCGEIKIQSGQCPNLDLSYNFTKCENQVEFSKPEVQCKDGEVVVIYRSEAFLYRGVFKTEKKGDGVTYSQVGSIWQGSRKRTGKSEHKDVVKTNAEHESPPKMLAHPVEKKESPKVEAKAEKKVESPKNTCGEIKILGGKCPHLDLSYQFKGCDPAEEFPRPQIRCGIEGVTIIYKGKENIFTGKFKIKQVNGQDVFEPVGGVVHRPIKTAPVATPAPVKKEVKAEAPNPPVKEKKKEELVPSTWGTKDSKAKSGWWEKDKKPKESK